MDPMTAHQADMTVPAWLTPLAWLFVALAVVAAVAVAVDIYGRGYRQQARPMEGVWVLSALWLGPLTLPLYLRLGRPHSPKWQQEQRVGAAEHLPGAATRGGLPGGAASLVAHVIGVPLVLATGLTIAGLDLYAMIAVIAVLATALLFLFELSVRSHRSTGRVGTALLVAAVTVLAFDVGMGGWMLLLHFNELMPAPTDVTFLFLMQIGIALGFLTGLPAVAALLKRGSKPAV
jgi:hypothetical protein